ncbi:hypothetical protein BC826DRAFT_1159051, partial [Russula brevipes]
PGPYSHTKPDLPYAALIGQAILASPERRLTLQEIYDFITIVYPHFKRNEQTWMNSIRHVLSTTIVFRKVQRDRAAGRTLWAIFDQDLDCFAGGGFRKEFCADMQEQREKARQASRKRAAEDTPTRRPRRKKLKTETPQEQVPPGLHPQMAIPMSTLPAVAYPGPPMFPGPRPGTTINPPTPPPPISRPSTSSSAISRIKMEPEDSPSPSLPPTSCSSVSLPDLTPNNSSSSPTGEPETDDQGAVVQAAESSSRASASVSPNFDISAFLVVPEDAPLDALAPGVTLLNASSAAGTSGASLKSKGKSKKGKEKEKEKEKAKAENDPPKTQKPFLPPAPESPTLVRQNVRPRTENRKPSTPPQKNLLSTSVKPLTTSPGRPCTPPGKNSEHHLSAARTPLSHLGVHMSPSASLAHYKSHLNPPPVTISLSHGDDTNPTTTTTTTNTKEGGHHGAEDSENLLRTPSRRRAGAGASQFTPFTPVTPRKLMFMGGVATESPLRGLFDHPHDPGTLLDEELARLGAQGHTPGRGGLHESPSVGFAQRALMYESPNTQSPERWTRMW